ncbi:MAG: hypothetical protein R2707_09275 [Acidimicrobiales bacterium]
MAFRNRFRKDDPTPSSAEAPAEDPAEGGGEPEADDVGLVLHDDEGGEWLAYELHEWASESRSMLEQLLLADGVVHSWQGTTLLAHESVEEQVDTLIDEVEQADTRELDPDEPQVAFEMEGWSGELQALLAERLGAVGVPHEFDVDGDLVCHEADEEQVELIIEELLARSADEGLEELVDLGANDLLSALFEATDRLRRDVHDSRGVLGVLEHGRRLEATATPFGFAATTWASLRDAAADLCDLIEDEESADEDISDHSLKLRDTLQLLI